MAYRLIGMGGKLRSGKDTVADYLVEKHGWVKFGMSDALAEALYELNPYIPVAVDDNDLYWSTARYQDLVDNVGYTEAKTNDEVRRLLQVLGTEVGRKMISENVWVNIIERKVALAHEQGQDVVLTGVRYPNELAMVHRNNGETWWVSRPETDGAAGGHSSETTLGPDDFDVEIKNLRGLNDLYAIVERGIE